MKSSNIKTKCLLVLVIMQFLSILFINFTKSYGFLDFDSSLAVRHALEMWENGIFLKDFNYFSTMEIDNAAFWAAPIYASTGNLSLALGCVHILFYTSICFLLYDIFKNYEMPMENFLLAVLLLFTPYTKGQLMWSNMFFLSVGQYEFRIIVMLLLLDLMIMCDLGQYKNRKFAFITVVYILMNFWTALSTGNYVLFMIVTPFILKIFLNILKHEKIVLRTMQNTIIVVSICTSFIGWRLHNYFVGASFRSDLTLTEAGNLLNNIFNCITGVYLLFGGVTRESGISIFSFEGIHVLMRFLFTTGCLILVGKEIFCCKKNKKIVIYFIPFAFVNLCVLFITNTRYGSSVFEERYHILWCVLLLLTLAFIVTESCYYKNNWIRNSVVYGLVFLVTAINVFGFYGLSRVDNSKAYEMSIINAAKQMHVDAVYLYDEMSASHVVRAIEPDLYCVSISSVDNAWHIDTGDMYKYYADNASANASNILICKGEEIDALPSYLKDSYHMIDVLDNQKNIYYSEKNPWDDISGIPLESVDYSVDFPYSNGFAFAGEISKSGELVAKKSEKDGYVLWGPYTKTIQGTYEIRLDYECINEEKNDMYIDIAVDGGATILEKQNLDPNSNTLILESVELPADKIMEVRIWKPANASIKIGRITYLRK